MPNYTYNLHLHTCLSPCGDNEMTPNNIVGMALLAGFDIIAITDHNSCLNCRACMEVGEKLGVLVIPGMELTTSEEAHVVCLFQTIEQAENFNAYVWERYNKIDNRPEIFGEQLIMNSEDEVIGNVQSLLINATNISVNDIVQITAQFDGCAFPAHIDKDSYSVTASLGTIPLEANFNTAEISFKGDVDKLKILYPELEQMHILQNSDAHYLEDIGDPLLTITLPEKSAEALVKKYKFPQ